VERLYSSFVAAGLDRKGVVVAVGGGVIGDIAGFAAACYLRGIRCVQVPTTLLAQVDSSVGGKTGVDLPEGKNLVGAFHQPALILIDLEALNTLPQRELRSGLAEVIKYGIITDEPFFYQTRDDLPAILKCDSHALKRAIMRSCEIKAAVVAEDEKEQGLRAILNFGHTVGHALESATQYRFYRHGEAIAIGMVTACLVGEDLGITPPTVTRDVSNCLAACGLPVEFPSSIDTAVIHTAMLLDKKTQSGRLRFVIAERIGKVRIVDDVPPGCVDRAIQRQKPS
jgi:3-dehydroquinate synthase